MEEGSKVIVPPEAHHPKRSRLVAAAVSSVFPGIGQILLGKTRAGVSFFCAYGVLASLYWPLRLPRSYLGMFAVIFASMGLFIAAGWHALRTPSQKAVPGSRWWLLMLVPLAYNASFWSDTRLLPLAGFRAFDVPSRSMEPTVIEGDRIIVDLTYYRQTKPKPIDIVVVQSSGIFSIKRVVATGGDTVEGRDGFIVVNGRALKEPYVEHIGDVVGLNLNESQFGPLTVAPRELFLLGDNRDSTIDSRSAEFGPITEDNVAGKVFYVVRHPQWWQAGVKLLNSLRSLLYRRD